MKTGRHIALFVGALALIEMIYVVAVHDEGIRTGAPTMAELVVGEDEDGAFLRTMIERQRAALALVERELAHGDDPRARKLAESMLATRKQELDAMMKLEGNVR